MPQLRSAKKRVRQNRKRRQRNKSLKTRVKKARKAVQEAIEAGEDEETLRQLEKEAVALLDQASGKNVFHANKSARIKSRLQQKVNDYVDEESS